MENFSWYGFWTRILPDWLTSIGTVGAVITAIVFSRRDNQIRLRIRAGVRVIVAPGEREPSPDFLSIEVVNLGRRQATLINLGWEFGWPWAKRHAVQSLDPRTPLGQLSKIPTTLSDGQSANYFMPLNDWLATNSHLLLDVGLLWRWLWCRLMKACVYTSTGDIFRCHIEGSLRSALLHKGRYRNRR